MITDLRLAWRMFVRGRGASVLTDAMLAAAMAGTLTLFSVLTALTAIWPELPRREQLAPIYASNPRFGVERDAIPLGSFSEWASRLATFQEVAAFADDDRRWTWRLMSKRKLSRHAILKYSRCNLWPAGSSASRTTV